MEGIGQREKLACIQVGDAATRELGLHFLKLLAEGVDADLAARESASFGASGRMAR